VRSILSDVEEAEEAAHDHASEMSGSVECCRCQAWPPISWRPPWGRSGASIPR
jgi:hypothetical protein